MRTSCLRAAIAALTLTACGDALVEQGYRGIPLYTFEGQVAAVNGGGTFDAPARAAVFWSPDGTTALTDALVEQSAISVAVRFPGTFTLNVFEGPGDVPWRDRSGAVRVGLILVYEDLDGDGLAGPGELRGGSANHVLLYAERAVEAAASPTGRALTPGFHAVRVPLPCEVEDSDGRAGDTCGVALGASCVADADCGPLGACLERDRYARYPGGYCVLPVGGCTPQGARTLATELGGVATRVWAAGCDEADQCRLAEGYVCENGVCLPGEPAALVLDPDLVVAPLCLAEGADEGD